MSLDYSSFRVWGSRGGASGDYGLEGVGPIFGVLWFRRCRADLQELGVGFRAEGAACKQSI